MESSELELCPETGKRDGKGRRLLQAADWHRLLAAYDDSGLTQRAFCRREGISYGTFVAWVGRRKRGLMSQSGGVRFEEVSLPGSVLEGRALTGHGLEVVLPGGMVLRGADAAGLARLVHLIGGQR